MASFEVQDKHYFKLAQIYYWLKNEEISSYYVLWHKKLYIKAIVENDFDINYKLPSNCFICQKEPDYAGNTALHFIMEFYDDNLIGIFDVLIELGVDLTIQNDSGYTPLLLAFIKGKQIDKILLHYFTVKNFENICCKNGISYFHIACSTNLTEIVDYYLKTGVSVNERVKDDSPNFAGYTPLHFAMQYFQPQTIELLLNHGANLGIKDYKNMTPLHLLMQSILQNDDVLYNKQKYEFIQHAIINNLFNLPDDAGFNCVHLSYILENFNFQEQSLDIETSVNLDSPIYAGYTPLHFAAHFETEEVVVLLEKGANLLIKDDDGTTPFDLCLEKFELEDIIEILLEEKRHQLPLKLKFTNGISVIDALRAMQKYDKLKQFLEKDFENINAFVSLESPLWPGCSLLHLAVIFDRSSSSYSVGYPSTFVPSDQLFDRSVNTILAHGASLTVLDANGMSPLHFAFRMMKGNNASNILGFYTREKKELVDVVDTENLSHLHIACAVSNINAVKNLLKNGADPNLSTLCDIQWKWSSSYYDVINAESTPLHITIQRSHLTYNDNEIIDVLLHHGANPNVADINGETPYHIALKNEQNEYFKLMLKSDPAFDRENVHEKLGLTKLQIACFIQDLTMLKKELESGADVNQCIAFDSPIWPGDTAFHLLYRGESLVKRSEFAELLLAHGADPSLQNSTNLTPIDLSKGELFKIENFLETNNFYVRNPVNNQGQSYLHVSCMTNNLLAVENFIKFGIDVNTPADYFANGDAGYTPLHCAVKCSNLRLTELLLQYGADPNNKAVDGFTPLHLAVLAEYTSYELFEILLGCPLLDIHASNILGETAIEMIIRMTVHREPDSTLDLFFKKGACLNFANLIKCRLYTLIFLIVCRFHLKYFQLLIANINDLTIIDDRGQNIIHYINSDDICKYDILTIYNNMKTIIDSGCEIDHKNNEGKTPLHLVASSGHKLMVRILLALGADINVKDDDKKVPYDYVSGKNCKKEFIKYMRKLEAAGFYTDEFDDLDSFDRDSFNSSSEEDDFRPSDVEDFFATPKKQEKNEYNSQLKKINPIFSTAYIMSEQFLKDYRKILESQRQAIYNLCKPFQSLFLFIQIQFRRAQTRNRLLVPAVQSFQTLTGLSVPEMSFEIVNYLNNDDLMNLIRAVNGKLEYVPLFEEN